MKFSELRSETIRRLGQESASMDFWTTADIEAAINDGYAEMSDESEWYERSLSIPLLANRTYYDLSKIAGTDFLAPRRCFNTTTNRWLDPTGIRELDNHTYRRWEVNQGEPQRMMQRGAWWLGCYPKKGSDSGFVRLTITAMPPALSADTDTPGFPQEFHIGIIEYALFDLLSQEQSTKKAVAHFTAFRGISASLRQYVDKRVKVDRVNAIRG